MEPARRSEFRYGPHHEQSESMPSVVRFSALKATNKHVQVEWWHIYRFEESDYNEIVLVPSKGMAYNQIDCHF